MSRRKLISDAAILTIVRERLLRGGERAVSFRDVAAATGLSAPALVLRFGSQAAMVSAALQAAWADLTKLAQSAAQDMGRSPKDVQEFLKRQADFADLPALLAHSLRSPEARSAATAYRSEVEAILAAHFGGGISGRNAAGLVFAAWQGRLAWGEAGGKTYRLGELIRSLD